MTSRIAFIGYGEAARAFRSSLTDRAARFAAFDVRTDDAMRDAMDADGIRRASDPSGAVEEADWVFSAVTADQSDVAAASVAPSLRRGQVYIDINSVSPDRKRQSAARIEAAGATYLDMAVMAPVHPRGHATPVLIAGPAAASLAPDLRGIGFELAVAGARVGDATAIKMVRSLFVKGLEAIAVETLIAASALGCFDAVLRSLSDSFPGFGWPRFAAYQFERTLAHGARRAAEMRESAATLDPLGLHGALAEEIANVQELMGAVPLDAPADGDLASAVAAIAAARRAQR